MKKRSGLLVFVIIFLLMTTVVFAAKPVKDPLIEVNEKNSYDASSGDVQLVLVFDLKQGNNELLEIVPSSGLINENIVKTNKVITTYELYYTWDITEGENPVTIDFKYDGTPIHTEAIDIINIDEPMNTAPYFIGEPYFLTTSKNNSASIIIEATDADGDALTYDATAPLHGTLSVEGNTYEYTPATDYIGSDSFDVSVSDGIERVTTTVNITVEDDQVNTPPDFEASSYNLVVNEDEKSEGIIVNATDPDGDLLEYNHTNGSYGIVEYLNGLYYYTPNLNFNGLDTFTVTVTDGKAVVSTDVSVTVNPVNDAPVAVDDFATAKVGETIQIDLLANDSDVDDDPLKAFVDQTEVLNGIYTYTADSEGYFELEYTLSDGSLMDTAFIKITVESDALVYVALGDSIPEGTYYRSIWDYIFGGTDSYSYIEQLRDTLGISSNNYFDESSSGFNAYEVYNQIANVNGTTADYVRKADLITLAVGANDIMDAASRSMSGLDKYDINWSIATEGLNSFEYYWPRIIDQIEFLNPDAKIIVMTVYNPYHDDEAIYSQVDSYFTNDGTIDFDSDGSIDWGLNDIINDTETTLDYSVADVYSAFNNHTNKDSLTGFYNSFCDPHPNQNGQDLIFDIHFSVY